MPLRFFTRQVRAQLERDLANTKFMRRLAQLSLYHYFRLIEWSSNRFPDFDRLRSVSAYFFKNLQKELGDFKKLPPKNKKDS